MLFTKTFALFFILVVNFSFSATVLFAQNNIALEATAILTSHVSPWEELYAINDGYDPESSTDKTGGAYGNWESGQNGDWDWVEYNWDHLQTIYQSDIYWWTDGGGIQIPSNAYQQYWDVLAAAWKTVPNAVGNGVEAGQYNTTSFDTLLTNKIRVYCSSSIATGILEWKIYGSPGEEIPKHSSCTINTPLAKGATSTVMLAAMDSVDNPIENYRFKFIAEILNEVADNNEEYIIDGVTYTTSQHGIELPQTDINGARSFEVAIPTNIDPNDGILIRVVFNNGFTQVGDTFSIHEPGLIPPTLLSDEIDNTVDNSIEITFADNTDWRNAITAVQINDISLTAGTDYEITSGKVSLLPAGGNPALIQAGSKEVSVLAAGFENTSITQAILPGIIRAENSSVASFLELYLHTKTKISAFARDQYGNALEGYVFTYDVIVTNTSSTTLETYLINQEEISANVSDQVFESTDSIGESFITLKIPDFVDENDGIRLQVKMADGTHIMPAASYVNDGNEKEIVLQRAVANNPDFNWDRTAQSDNFIVFWGSKIDGDPTDAGNGELSFDPKNILEIMESLLVYMTDTIGLIQNADQGNMARYKHEVVMNETWSTDFTGWAFGGSIGDNTIGGMWIHPGATNGAAVLAHEFTHMCQAMVMAQYPGYGLNTPFAGFFWESHANYIMAQYSNTYTGVQPERYINTSMLHFSTTRHYYQNLYFIDYISDTYGLDTVNLIWRMADPKRSHPITSLRDSVLRYTQHDLNNDIGHYAMRNVTWDYKNGGLIRKAIRSVNPIYVGREYTILDSVPDGSGRYVVPRYLAPGDYGYNIVPLFPDEGISEISLEFASYENTPAEGAGSRFGFVAVSTDGTPRYSDLYTELEGTAMFALEPSDSAIFLVVTGAPTTHHNYGWTTGFPKEYRYPYSIKITGAIPAGHKSGYNHFDDGTPGAAHANGGGWVASSATVAETAYVGPNAQVLDKTIVNDNVRVEDYAIVTGNAIISGGAIIRGNSVVGSTSVVSDQVLVEKTARVYGTQLRDNTVVTGSALVYSSSISGQAIIKDLAYLNNVNLSGTVIIGGDAEEYTNCSSGTYLQMQTVRTSGCDGRINHKLNVDINPDWDIYQYPLGDLPTAPFDLNAANVTSSSVDLSWSGSMGNNEITGYYIIQNQKVAETIESTSATITGLESGESYTYTIQAIDRVGNVSGQSNEVMISTIPSAIYDTKNDLVVIFPNPTSQSVSFRCIEPTEINMRIFDVSGKTIVQKSFTNSITLSREEIGDSGIYMVELRNGNRIVVDKLIVQ